MKVIFHKYRQYKTKTRKHPFLFLTQNSVYLNNVLIFALEIRHWKHQVMKKHYIFLSSLLIIAAFFQKNTPSKFAEALLKTGNLINASFGNLLSDKNSTSSESSKIQSNTNKTSFPKSSLLFQKNEIEITKNNSLVKRYYFEISIADRFDEKLTKISIPYTKRSKIQELKAHIKDGDGKTVRVLKKGDIIDKSDISDISLYEDNMVKEFTLNHNSYPYTICYSYKQEEKEFLYIDYWIPVLDPEIPTLSAELSLTVPSDFPISISQNNLGEPEISEDGKQKKYIWKTSYTNLIPRERLMPPIREFLPYVKIVPHAFRYDKKGFHTDWTSFGDWEVELLKGLNDIPNREKEKTDQIIRGISDKREQIRALYHYLQNETRYINVAIDKGGLKPFPASYVSTNKYGDCKALTNYMKSLLELYQIKAYYTNVYAGDIIQEVDKDFPSQQFNHVILFVPLENDSIWLDCTSKGPFNYLGTFSQNRNAFVIDYNNSSFVRTPSLLKEQVLSTRNISVNLSGKETAELFYQNTYRGKTFEMLNSLETLVSKNEQKKIIQDYIVGRKEELLAYEIIKKRRDDCFVQLNYSTRSTHVHNVYGNDIIVPHMGFKLPQLENPNERKLPVQINYPVYETDTVTYRFPSGFALGNRLNNQVIESKYGYYKTNYAYANNSITVIKTLFLNSGYYKSDDYNNFYLFIEKIKNAQNSAVFTLTKQNS